MSRGPVGPVLSDLLKHTAEMQLKNAAVVLHKMRLVLMFNFVKECFEDSWPDFSGSSKAVMAVSLNRYNFNKCKYAKDFIIICG